MHVHKVRACARQTFVACPNYSQPKGRSGARSVTPGPLHLQRAELENHALSFSTAYVPVAFPLLTVHHSGVARCRYCDGVLPKLCGQMVRREWHPPAAGHVESQARRRRETTPERCLSRSAFRVPIVDAGTGPGVQWHHGRPCCRHQGRSSQIRGRQLPFAAAAKPRVGAPAWRLHRDLCTVHGVRELCVAVRCDMEIRLPHDLLLGCGGTVMAGQCASCPADEPSSTLS